MQSVPTEHLFFRFCERIRDLVDKDFLSISHKFVVRKTRIVHLYILLDMLRSTGNAFILKQLGLVKVNTGHGPSHLQTLDFLHSIR